MTSRKIGIMFASVAALAALTACKLPESGRDDVHAKVCVKADDPSPDSYLRLAENQCGGAVAGARWRYYGENIRIAAVGDGAPRLTGTWDEPEGSLVTIPAKGGFARQEFDK